MGDDLACNPGADLDIAGDWAIDVWRPSARNPRQAHGRGATENPTGRFERIEVVYDPHDDPGDEARSRVKTQYLKDTSRSLISFNDSPDVGGGASINPYRGCEHGCIYCYARPTHEYLGMSCGLDFETRILVKTDAPRLLREAFLSRSWQPQTLMLSGNTDCYQPVERKLKLTRACLEVLAEFRNPVGIITKNHLVTRDIDLLQELAAHQAVSVSISVTSLDERLTQVMEPRTARPELRLRAIRELSGAGIPVNVMMGPIIPGLTDHEIDAILQAAAEAGATGAAYNMVRLPYGVKDLFQSWLETYFPDRANRVLNRIRDVRGGRLNDARFGSRMRGEGEYARFIAQRFAMAKRRYGLDAGMGALSTAAFTATGHEQLRLF